MEIYKRNITGKLWILRLGFTATLTFIAYLFLNYHTDYAIVLLFLLLCGTVFPVTGLKITPGCLEIRQYYVYGIVHRKWIFYRTEKVRIEPFDLVISDAGTVHTDDWYDLFFIAVPTKEITVRKYLVKYYDSWSSPKQIKLTLSAKEIAMLQKCFPAEPMPVKDAS